MIDPIIGFLILAVMAAIIAPTVVWLLMTQKLDAAQQLTKKALQKQQADLIANFQNEHQQLQQSLNATQTSLAEERNKAQQALADQQLALQQERLQAQNYLANFQNEQQQLLQTETLQNQKLTTELEARRLQIEQLSKELQENQQQRQRLDLQLQHEQQRQRDLDEALQQNRLDQHQLQVELQQEIRLHQKQIEQQKSQMNDLQVRIKDQEQQLKAEQQRIQELEAKLQAEQFRALQAETELRAERELAAVRKAEQEHYEEMVRENFAKLSQDALQQNTDMFLRMAQERLDQQHQQLHGNLDSMFTPLHQLLEQQRQQVDQLEQQRQQAYSSIHSVIEELRTGHQQLQGETQQLVQVLSKPQTRGRWGEMQLRRVVEMAGMLEYCDFEISSALLQQRGFPGPDLIVRLPNQRHVVVDAKVPLHAFLEALSNNDAEQWQEHCRLVREHIDTLEQANYPALLQSSFDNTILFIPGEIFYQTALEHDPELLEYAFAKGIILASPNTLLAILKAIAFNWREANLTAQAAAIRSETEKMLQALRSTAEQVHRIGRGLRQATQAYNDSISTIEMRLLPPVRSINAMQVFDSYDHKQFSEIEITPRHFLSDELRQAEHQPEPETDPEPQGPSLGLLPADSTLAVDPEHELEETAVFTIGNQDTELSYPHLTVELKTPADLVDAIKNIDEDPNDNFDLIPEHQLAERAIASK